MVDNELTSANFIFKYVCLFSKKSISRDVRMPTNFPPNLPFSVIGIPQKPCSFLTLSTSDI